MVVGLQAAGHPQRLFVRQDPRQADKYVHPQSALERNHYLMSFDVRDCLHDGPRRKAAWDAFVQHTVRIIYAAVQRTMTRWPHDHSEIEDRVQDVYVKLMQDDGRLLKTFDPKRASLSTWLTLVARSTTRDIMEKRRVSTVSIQGHDPSDSASAPDPPPGESIDQAALPMDLLTERQRVVLRMLFDEGLSVEQAASRLNVDPQTIRSTKHKALSRLREALHHPTEHQQSRRNTSKRAP